MDSCKNIRENIVLHIYNELDEQQSANLQAHLGSCPACKGEFLKTQKLLQALPQKPLLQPDGNSLNMMRKIISLNIRKSAPGFQLPRGLFTFVNPKPAFQIGFAALLLILGFFVGKSTSETSANAVTSQFLNVLAAQQDIATGNAYVSPFLLDIERIQYDKESGKIEIAYNTINDIHLQGKPTDNKIHALLQQALQEPDDISVRLKAVKTVSALAETNPQFLDSGFRDVLGQLLINETNLGLRLRVLKIFKSMPWSDEIKSVLQSILLHDEEKAMRIAAFRTITERQRPLENMREILTVARKDSSTFIKFRANKLLEELKNVESFPLRNED